MSATTIALLSIVVLVILFFLRMQIAFAMAFVAFVGYAYLDGLDKALLLLKTIPYSTIAFYPLSALPLYVLMGTIVANTGAGADLYSSANKWLGQMRGGLAVATVVACAGFAAMCGSSMATALTMGRVALPEMVKHKYEPSLAAGTVAAGGTLGILIPPSLGFIIYGILTQESIGKLFMAGIFPGVLMTSLFAIVIVISSLINPQLAPKGMKVRFKEKVGSLSRTWPVVVLFLLVIGGLYAGIFTPTESAAIGSFGAIIIGIVQRRLTKNIFFNSLLDTGRTVATVFMLLMCAYILSPFLALTRLPFEAADFIARLTLPTYITFAIIVIVYLFLGCFLDINACIIITIPMVFPIILNMGFDPIWFGVIVVILIEMGMITPPFGINVFILAGITDIPLGTIFKGILPFTMAQILTIVILYFFPQIATFLPSRM